MQSLLPKNLFCLKFNTQNNPLNASRSTLHEPQIDTLPANSILFISAPPGTLNAVYGGLMSNRAQYLGAAGTIVNGRVRDLQEHRDLDYPVFARDVGTTAPQEVLRVGKVRTCCCHNPSIFVQSSFGFTVLIIIISSLIAKHPDQQPHPSPIRSPNRHHPSWRLPDRRPQRRRVSAAGVGGKGGRADGEPGRG